MNSIEEVLKESRVIAVVGLSPKPERASHDVAAYLQQQGYRIIPINPTVSVGETILGEKVYANLRDIPFPIEVVDVFRKSEAVPSVAEDALALTPKPKVFWMQLEIENEEAARKLRSAGIFVVQNACMKIEHEKRARQA